MADFTTYAADRITYRGSTDCGHSRAWVRRARRSHRPGGRAETRGGRRARAEAEAEATARLGPTGLVSLIRAGQGAWSASAASAVRNVENSRLWAGRRALSMKKAGRATSADPADGPAFPG
jgi:hypothetical protein